MKFLILLIFITGCSTTKYYTCDREAFAKFEQEFNNCDKLQGWNYNHCLDITAKKVTQQCWRKN